MPRPRLIVVASAIAVVAVLALTMRGAPPKLGPTPVVVELFTSQGCSSCPPAEALIHDIAGDAKLRGHVIPLAFHVDYSDRLGSGYALSPAAASPRPVRYPCTHRLSPASPP